MKNILFTIALLTLLSSAAINCTTEALPFLKGKYIFWPFFLSLIVCVFTLYNSAKNLKFNSFDVIVSLLMFYGIIHFVLFSKATIFNNEIWNFCGYFILYHLLRNELATKEITIKIQSVLLYFCAATSIINIFLMYAQWQHWIASPNQFFVTTGMFFSPNQLGIYLSIGLLSALFLWQKTTILWVKFGLGLCCILIFIGLCITASRGAFISFLCASGFYIFISKMKLKSFLNWKIYLGIFILFIGGFYFISIVNKNKTDSTSGRFFTTKMVLKQIVENPMGYGLNSFALEYNKAKSEYFTTNPNWEEMKNAGYIYKANNDLLELTFELGVPWMILFLLFIRMLFLKNNDNIECKIATTILFCLLIFSLTTSITTTPIFVIIICVCAVIIINSSVAKVIYVVENKLIYKFLNIILCLTFVIILLSRINAEHKLSKLYEGSSYLKGEKQVQNYVSKIDNNGDELFMAGLILIKNSQINTGFNFLQRGFDRSGKPSLGRVLANGLKQQKKYSKVEEIYSYNKNVEPYRFEARMDLLNLFIESKQDKKAKAMAQEIIQLQVKIPSAKIESYKRVATDYLYKFDD